MTSLSTIRLHIKQDDFKRGLEQRANQAIAAADHFTEVDRAVAENLEARELFAAFIVEEI